MGFSSPALPLIPAARRARFFCVSSHFYKERSVALSITHGTHRIPLLSLARWHLSLFTPTHLPTMPITYPTHLAHRIRPPTYTHLQPYPVTRAHALYDFVTNPSALCRGPPPPLRSLQPPPLPLPPPFYKHCSRFSREFFPRAAANTPPLLGRARARALFYCRRCRAPLGGLGSVFYQSSKPKKRGGVLCTARYPAASPEHFFSHRRPLFDP
jgi:hypothetical protein